MKKLPIIILALVLTFLASAGGYAIGKSQSRTRPLEQVIVDGDEMPGLTDRSHPDTCIAYMLKDNIVHLQYTEK